MKFTVDRFESSFALCEREDGSMVRIPVGRLPAGTKEGSILVEKKSNLILCETFAAERRGNIKDKMKTKLKKQ